MRLEMRLENRLDLTTSPKIYFCLIYAHYDEEVMKIQEVRKRVRKRVRSNHLPDILVKYKKIQKNDTFSLDNCYFLTK